MQIRCLDFGNVIPKAGILGPARHLVWPVDGYRVSLPRTIDDVNGLNPFERVVLEIMRLDHLRDPKRVAEEVCLESDFVEGVLLRLQDKGFIDEQNRVTEEGFVKLNSASGGLELRTAWVFRELVSGKLLPFFYMPRDDNPPSWKKNPKEKDPKGAWEWRSYKRRTSAPTPEEVLSAMTETKKRVECTGRVIHLPKVGQIDVSPNTEKFYLDCPIVMRDTDGRWRIADPFGYGYSRELEATFLQELAADDELSRWLMKWSDSLVVKTDKDESDDSRRSENQALWKLYPGLMQNLRTGKDKSRTIGQVYGAIEWALYYCCRINGFEDKVDDIRFSSQADQVKLFKEAMRAIGCNYSAYVSPVGKQELNNYLAGSAEMRTVLPMAVLQAADDPSHPLRRFCKRHPDFIARIGRMQERRGAPMHGGDGDWKIEQGAPDEVFMMDLVSTLIPQVSFEDSRIHLEEGEKETVRNVSFNAENSIMGEFGPATPYLKMSRGAREALLGAERLWMTCENEEDIQPFLNYCYAALQAILDAEIISDRVFRPDSKSFDPRIVAADRCERLNLGELPGGLMSAKRTFIQDALQGGGNHTLGPSLIVYLALADEEKLRDIESAVPGFALETCELIRQRGHGNGTVLGNKEDVGQLRAFVFDFIKAVLEV